MGRAYCLLKPGAQALIGVPTGPDRLVFNAARLYGPNMYPHLFANWKQVHTENDFTKFREDCLYCYQPVHVLERPLENVP